MIHPIKLSCHLGVEQSRDASQVEAESEQARERERFIHLVSSRPSSRSNQRNCKHTVHGQS
jgi:hypothetical protein